MQMRESVIRLLVHIHILWGTFSNLFDNFRILAFRRFDFDCQHVDLMPPIISKIKPVSKGFIFFEFQVVHDGFPYVPRQFAAYYFVVCRRETVSSGFGVIGSLAANLELI